MLNYDQAMEKTPSYVSGCDAGQVTIDRERTVATDWRCVARR